jgi:hypothetical protein
VRQSFVRRYWSLCLLAVPVIFVATAFRPVSAPASEMPTTDALPTAIAAIAAPLEPTSSPPPATETAAEAAPTSAPTQPPAPPTDTPIPGTLTPTVQPTPTARPAGTPPRVGLQVGHWKSNELPDELARLRTSTGAIAGGYTEAEINFDVAQRVAALLRERGIIVDILPATVPPGYDADAFVALHADGSSSGGAHGFKIATPWRTSRAGQHLLDALTAEYALATGMPWDDAITFNMRGYFAFNYRRHEHAIKKTTPAVIVEMGFLTNAADRAMLTGKPDLLATGIANGIIRYLNERDPNDGAALLPPEFKTQRSISPDGVDVRAAPRDDARILIHYDAERRLNPLMERDGWYQVFARVGEQRLLGWVRKDQLIETNDPTPTPLPSTDS